MRVTSQGLLFFLRQRFKSQYQTKSNVWCCFAMAITPKHICHETMLWPLAFQFSCDIMSYEQHDEMTPALLSGRSHLP